jgi:hypothetical protein
MSAIIVITPAELETLIHDAIESAFASRELKNETTYTINQVAHILHRSHKKITALTNAGAFKTTLDGKILQSSLNQYLKS